MNDNTVLVNGIPEHKALLPVVRRSLSSLVKHNPITFYELVMKARNPNHQVWSDDAMKPAIALNLISLDYKFHASIKNVILALVVGDGLDMMLK